MFFLLSFLRIWCYEFTRTLVFIGRTTLFPIERTCDHTVFSSFVDEKHGTSQEKLSFPFFVLSWNILRNYAEQKIVTSLALLVEQEKPSVLFLQEVPIRSTKKFWDTSFFQEWHLFYAPSHLVLEKNVFYNFEQSGQLIASRVPFTKTAYYPLPIVAHDVLGKMHKMRRCAAYAQIKSDNNKKIGLYNVHLELACAPSGRKKQLAHLYEIISKNNDDIVIVGGDFNTCFGGFFETCLKVLPDFANVFFSFELRLFHRLDYFLVKGTVASGKNLSGKGSDHQPIGVKLE